MTGIFHLRTDQDIFGNRIGMLYVVSWKRSITISEEMPLPFLLDYTAGMCVAVGLGYGLGTQIMDPVNRL